MLNLPPIMLNPAPLIHPIISGDVRGGDLHGERPVQERGPGSLQQKPRFRQSFPGGFLVPPRALTISYPPSP